jgi:hypothetical protein
VTGHRIVEDIGNVLFFGSVVALLVPRTRRIRWMRHTACAVLAVIVASVAAVALLVTPTSTHAQWTVCGPFDNCAAPAR